MAFGDLLGAVTTDEYVAIRCSDERVSFTPMDFIEIEEEIDVSKDMSIGRLYKGLRLFWEQYVQGVPENDRVVGYIPAGHSPSGSLFVGMERQRVLEYAYDTGRDAGYEFGL